jgi:SWIM zinc finger
MAMVHHITPFMFMRRKLQAELLQFKRKRHAAATGLPVPQRPHVPLAFYEPHDTLDPRAQAMVCLDACIIAPVSGYIRSCRLADQGVGFGVLLNIRLCFHFQLDAGKVVSVVVRADTLIALVQTENLFNSEPGSGSAPYTCCLLPWARVACDCPNFQSVGGYCKHLRAALLKVWVSCFMHVCPYEQG